MEPTPNNNDDNSSSFNQSSTYNLEGSHTHMFLVSNPLIGNENYIQWKYSIRIALGERGRLDSLMAQQRDQKLREKSLMIGFCNDCMVRSWLLNAISKEIAGAFIFSTTVRKLWLDLEEHFGESNGPLIYQLQRQISSITCIVQFPTCTCGSGKALDDLTSSTQLM
ncbi:hypothetical protein LXL04_028577 [Taraxacum kok-saghyz]